MARGEGLVLLFVDEGVVSQAELDGIFLELDGEFVHRGLEGEEAGDGSRATHGGWSSDVALDEGGGDLQVGDAVEEWCRFAAVLADVVDE